MRYSRIYLKTWLSTARHIDNVYMFLSTLGILELITFIDRNKTFLQKGLFLLCFFSFCVTIACGISMFYFDKKTLGKKLQNKTFYDYTFLDHAIKYSFIFSSLTFIILIMSFLF